MTNTVCVLYFRAEERQGESMKKSIIMTGIAAGLMVWPLLAENTK